MAFIRRIHHKLHWIPVTLTGILVLFFSLRTPILKWKLQSKLNEFGFDATIEGLEWKGIFRTKIARINCKSARISELLISKVQLNFLPAFSLSPQKWLSETEIGQFECKAMGFSIKGKGRYAGKQLASEGKLSYKDFASSNWKIEAHDLHSSLLSEKQIHFQFSDTRILHPKFSKNEKQIPIISGDFNIKKDAEGRILVNHQSQLQAQELEANIGGTFDHNSKLLDLSIHLPEQKAQNLLDLAHSVSDSALDELVVSGNLSGNYHFKINMNSLQSLEIGGELQASQVQIVEFGKSRLDNLQNELANTKALELPSFFIPSILLSEDANFESHYGFDSAIIRQAILENIQERRFVRGAGTIPMQIVRNQCLHQTKQLDRKISEVTLTWILERQIAAPNRASILNLYLQSIEWGPNIYGLTEASEFYFGKLPKSLSLDEVLFLCLIVPNPKQYAKVFDRKGKPKEFAQVYFESMKWMLYEESHISEEEFEAEISLSLRSQCWQRQEKTLI